MTKMGFKKTLNLHQYSIRFQYLLSEWKFILSLIVVIIGLVLGSLCGKGEGDIFQKLTNTILSLFTNSSDNAVYIKFIINLIIPTIFFIIVFFCGLSAYGGLISHLIPFSYSVIIGAFTYFLYSEYKLKGLAFFVILILPYVALSLLGILLMTVESINMSQTVLNILNNRSKRNTYSFNIFYKNALRSYIPIVLSAIIKTVLDKLFLGIFSF